MNGAISLSIALSFAALDTHIGVGTENLNSENANSVRNLQGHISACASRGQVSIREAGRARDTDGGVYPLL